MGTDSQFTTSTIPTASTPSTNRYGLSPVQIKMLNFPSVLEGSYRVSVHEKSYIKRASKLEEMGLLSSKKDVEWGIEFYTFTLTPRGREALVELGLAPADKEGKEEDTEDEHIASVLPQAGEVVRVHYFVDPAFKHEIYDCTVEAVKDSTVFGTMLKVKPTPNKFNLPSRWVTLHQLAKPEAPATQQTAPTVPTLADVRKLEEAWFALVMKPKTFDEAIAEPHATQQQNAHTRYMIAKSLNENAPLLMPCEELITQMNKEEAVTPAAPTPAPVSAEAQSVIGTPVTVPPLNERAPTWYERMVARENHWAAQAAIQFGRRTPSAS